MRCEGSAVLQSSLSKPNMQAPVLHSLHGLVHINRSIELGKKLSTIDVLLAFARISCSKSDPDCLHLPVHSVFER